MFFDASTADGMLKAGCWLPKNSNADEGESAMPSGQI
jgi:hypothetical protein